MSELELRDAILRHSLQILRLSAGEQAAVDQILKDLEKELRALLESQSLSGAERAQLKALVEQAESAIHPAYAAAAKSADTHALALVVAEKTVEAMEAFPIAALMPSAERLASLTKDVLIDGAPSSAWWARQAEDTAFKFAAQVRQGVVNGETNERIVQRIVGRRGEPGIMEVSRRNARSLVHSSVMTAANEARLATFRKNDRLIKGVRWLSTLDSHTCVQCAALDNAAWDLGGKPILATRIEFMTPPAHFACRCVLSPIPKTFRDIGLNIDEPDEGTRASSEGPVPASTTFDDFLRRQTPAFINKTLGKERAALFLAGKITLRDLISGTGREITLDELRKL
jgi:hypothetical protein